MEYGKVGPFSFIKFVSLFEKNSQTLVYGFDWFKGMKPGANDDFAHQGKYATSYKGLLNLLKTQGLDKIGNIQKMDLSSKFKPFLMRNKWMRFKLVFIDCGIEKFLLILYHMFGLDSKRWHINFRPL